MIWLGGKRDLRLKYDILGTIDVCLAWIQFAFLPGYTRGMTQKPIFQPLGKLVVISKSRFVSCH